MRNLIIDGTTDDGLYYGYTKGYTGAPYAVFDPKAQDWITCGVRYLWLARAIKWWHGGGWRLP